MRSKLTDEEKRILKEQKIAAKKVKKQGTYKRIDIALQSDMPLLKKVTVISKLLYLRLKTLPKYFVLIALSVIFIAPFFYIISHSLMGTTDILDPNVKWLPTEININNFVYAYHSLDYFTYLFNSLWIVGISVFGQILTCSFVAYGIARVKFRLSGLIFAIVLFIMIVPPQTIFLPNFLMFVDTFGWDDSFLPMIIPCFFAMGLNGGLIIFVFRQFFKGLPSELENAALIDGVGIFGAYFRVIIPNTMPAVLINSILCLVWHWNNSFEPSVFIRTASKGTLVMQLTELHNRLTDAWGGVDFNAGIRMAATLLVLLPIIVIFFALQGRFMKNMANTGLAN